MSLEWKITEDKLNTLIEWYATSRVLAEEFEREVVDKYGVGVVTDEMFVSTPVIRNLLCDEMYGDEYFEINGKVMAYQDWFRMIGVYPGCIKIKQAMKRVREENSFEEGEEDE